MTKKNSITLQPEVATSVKVSNPFTWTTVQKFYNLLPLGIASCKSIYEAKMYTVAFIGYAVSSVLSTGHRSLVRL